MRQQNGCFNRGLMLSDRKKMSPARLSHRIARDMGFHTRVTSGPEDLIDQVARMTLRERLVHFLGDALNEIFRDPFLAGNQAHLSLSSENLEELIDCRIIHVDFVGDST